MSAVTTVVLNGCRPEPLLHYLKGLAILRLVSTQTSGATVRGYWMGDRFALESSLGEMDLVEFFLERYRPTPVIAPWNGGSGFWDNSAAGQALGRMENTQGERFSPYRDAIHIARTVLLAQQLDGVPKDDAKERLLRGLRATLPDSALDWVDAAVALTDDGLAFTPLLGTGGNDGRFDFTANFLQRLGDVLPLTGEWASAERKRVRKGDGPLRTHSEAWLRAALFDEPGPALLRAALGQFHPGGAGGPNATAGMEGTSLVNPWDFILLIEGAMALAGSVARRLGSEGYGRAAVPFTVGPTAAGWGTLAEQDEGKARAEVWLPLWSKPASWGATRHLFTEGRAEVMGHQARTGLDFARAVASLGVDRMVDQFQRYGFLERNGLAYLAVPLNRVRVEPRFQTRLIDEVVPWLSQAERAVGTEGPQSLGRALRQAQRAILAYSQKGERAALQDLLIAAANAEAIAASSRKLQEKIRPIRLSFGWFDAISDETPEFALAASLAAIDDRSAGPLCYHWRPLSMEKNGRLTWLAPSSTEVDLTNLPQTMAKMLQRRMLFTQQESLSHLPIWSPLPARWEYVHLFLEGRTDDARIGRLLAALALLNWREQNKELPEHPASSVPALLNRGYALLKPLFWPGPFRPRQLAGTEISLQAPGAVLSRLGSGDLTQPILHAARKLHAAGLTPAGYREGIPFEIRPPGGSAMRIAAALLLPVRSPQPLFDMVLPASHER